MNTDVVSLWRDLHAIPELGFHEVKTSAYAADAMRRLGYEVHTGFGNTTAVVAYKRTSVLGPTVMVRCDMDALPFKNPDGSVVAVHACGHDAHVAMQIATAAQVADSIKKGTLKFLFQPAEETLDGALSVIDAGVLDDVDMAFGMHIRPVQDMPAGSFCAAVNYTASAFIGIDIKGEACHASRPHLGVNAAEAASLVTNAICAIKLNPLAGWSCKVTQIHAASAAVNVVPDTAQMWLDARAENNALMDELIEKVRRAAEFAAQSVGATASLVLKHKPIPAPSYTPSLVRQAQEEIIRLFGRERLSEPCGGGGEDFNYFVQAKPELKNAYFGIGVGAEPGLHNRAMHFSPEYLKGGVALMSAMICRQLG